MTNTEIESSIYSYYENCRPLESGKYSMAKFGDNKMVDKLIDLSDLLIQTKGFPLKLN